MANYYSDEVQEIMGRIPSWIVRWGITVIFAIFSAILIGCYFIRYPEIVEVYGMIVPKNTCDGTGFIAEEPIDGNGDFLRDSSAVCGQLRIPSGYLRKIKSGQVVFMRLNAYPPMEFGKLKGYVYSVSTVPEQIQTSNGTMVVYSAEVVFPKGLTTTYCRELPGIWLMDGTAEIIMENTRLISRLIQPVTSLCKKH